MVGAQISLSGVKKFETFRVKFPDQVNKSLDDTAAYGKGLMMKSTAKGPTGLARSSWDWIKNGEWMRLIFNPLHYIKYLETGTGLFGPKHARITSTSGGPLHWVGLVKKYKRGKKAGTTEYRSRLGSKKGGYKETDIFAMSTKGMPAQPMVEPNKDAVERDLMLRMRRTILMLWRAAAQVRDMGKK